MRTDDSPTAPQTNENAHDNYKGQASSIPVTVAPEVKVPPSHTCYQIAYDKKRDGWDYSKMIAEFVGLGFLIAYTIFAGQQVSQMRRANKISRDTFNAANRPYVGPNTFTVQYGWTDAKGVSQHSHERRTEATRLIFDMQIKNFGPVPGTNYINSSRAFLGNKSMEAVIGNKPLTFFPTQTFETQGKIDGEDFQAVMSGNKKFFIRFDVSYDGPAQHYSECQNAEFSPVFSTFVSMGPCTE
jgi:hypothetical protein